MFSFPTLSRCNVISLNISWCTVTIAAAQQKVHGSTASVCYFPGKQLYQLIISAKGIGEILKIDNRKVTR